MSFYPLRGITCCHTVLLTREWSRQAGLVKMMMDRTNQTPPQSLLDMVEELNKVRVREGGQGGVGSGGVDCVHQNLCMDCLGTQLLV